MASTGRIVDYKTIQNIPRLLARYQRNVNREAYKGLIDVAKSTVVAVKTAVVTAPPTRRPSNPAMPLVLNGAVASGKYRDDWRAKRMTLGGVMGVLIYNTQPHAPIVEYGRKPGSRPPFQAIRQWLQKKFGMPYRQARKLAYPVANSIKKRGIPGRKILTNDTTIAAIYEFLDDALAKAINRAVTVTFP